MNINEKRKQIHKFKFEDEETVKQNQNKNSLLHRHTHKYILNIENEIDNRERNCNKFLHFKAKQTNKQ